MDDERKTEIIPNQAERSTPLPEEAYLRFRDRYIEDMARELAKLPRHVNWAWPYA